MRETGLRLLYLAILSYAIFCVYLYLAQRSFLYFPTPETRLPQAASIVLQSDGETLRIWARPRDGPGAVIYFGGNGEDVAANFDDFARAMPGRAIYLVNYRGYGGSTGAPSEAALFRDALAVYDWAARKHSDLAVIGASLGSGVAVLVTPYDSLANVAQEKMRLFPVSLLLRDRFDSASRVPGVAAKTLILIAGEDEMIPRARSEALAAKFPAGQAKIEVIRGATHNGIAADPAYLRLIGAFL
jgi:uncharacterized protein